MKASEKVFDGYPLVQNNETMKKAVIRHNDSKKSYEL